MTCDKDPPVHSGGGVVPSKRFTKPGYPYVRTTSGCQQAKERFSGVDGKISGISNLYLKVEGQTQDLPGTPEQHLLTCALCLAIARESL